MKFLVILLCSISTILAGPRYFYPRTDVYPYSGYYSSPADVRSPYLSYYSSSPSEVSSYAAPISYSYPTASKATQPPSAKAALAFLNALPLDTCGRQAKAFIEDILSGGSSESATAKATAIYKKDYEDGDGPAPNSACLAAEVAWKKAHTNGQDPVLNSALAFMKAYESESPCAVSAFDYVQAIVNGKPHAEANVAAMKSFIAQIKSLAAQGKSTVDPVCAKSALAYADSTGISTPNSEAMRAFIAKALETGNSLDPVCLAAAEDVIEGKSNYAAAKTFVKLYKNSPTAAADSPCAAAAKAYSAAVTKSPSPGNQAAMIAFIDESVASNSYGLSPACQAAAEAYFAAFDNGATDGAATAAAGKAFLAAVQGNPALAFEFSCAKAAQAFMNYAG